jgi:hypothetical protein
VKKTKWTYLRKIISKGITYDNIKVVCFGMSKTKTLSTTTLLLECGHHKTILTNKRKGSHRVICEECAEEAGDGHLLT